MKIFILILFLTGCSTNPYKGMSDYEKVWQVSHLIDSAQTYKIANDPCYLEGNPITKKVIGRDPNTDKALLWAAGLSFGHAHASKWVEKSSLPDWAKWTLGAIDLGIKYDAISNNYNIGIRLGKSNIGEAWCN